MEAATPDSFEELSSTKNYQTDIIRRMKWIKRLNDRNRDLAPSGQTTQFIVGATSESDEEILKRVEWLYKKIGIKRSYFSQFHDWCFNGHCSPFSYQVVNVVCKEIPNEPALRIPA